MALEASICSKCGSKGLAPLGTKKCFCGGDMVLFNVTEDEYIEMSDYEIDRMIEEMNIHPLISKDDALAIYTVTRSTEIIDAMIELKQKDIIEYGLKLAQFKTQLEQQKSAKEKAKTDNRLKCPTCGSAKVIRIPGLSKAIWVALQGVYSIGKISKTFQCMNCGYKW